MQTTLDNEITNDINDKEKKCKGGNCHHFTGNQPPLLSFCKCQTWQVIEIINQYVISCIDIFGVMQLFDRRG